MVAILDDFTWLMMQIHFFGFYGLVVAIMILIALLKFSPAGLFVKAKLRRGTIVLSCYRRDSTHAFKAGRYASKSVITKDGYYHALPKVAGVNGGTVIATCYEETGTSIPPLVAAASGLLKQHGIPDAEVATLFNMYVKDGEEEFMRKISNDEFLKSKAYPRGTWEEVMHHVRSIWGSDGKIVEKLRELSESIPMVESAERSPYPVFWTKKEGLGCRYIGSVIYWEDVKDFQIYHLDPAAVMTTIKAEAFRIAQKYFKDRSEWLVKGAVAFAIIVGVMVFGYLLLQGHIQPPAVKIP